MRKKHLLRLLPFSAGLFDAILMFCKIIFIAQYLLHDAWYIVHIFFVNKQRIGVGVTNVLWKFVLAAVALSTFWPTGARGPFLEMSGNVSGLKSNIQIKIWRYVHTLPDSSCAFAIFITRYILFLVQSFLSNAKRTISSKFLLKITRDCKEK